MTRGRSSTPALLLAGLCFTACGDKPTLTVFVPPPPFDGLDGTQWAWTSASCDDGAHTLDTRGFDERMRLRVMGRSLRLLRDVSMSADGCAETLVTWVSEDGAAFHFAEQARVADAPDRACSGSWPREHGGELRVEGDAMDLRVYRSQECGGYDIRHHYARVARSPLDDRALIRHVVAGLSLRDPALLVGSFSTQGSLVVPRAAAEGGGMRRVEGRAGVERWFSEMLRSVAWVGARVLEIVATDAGGYVAHVEYMDSALSEPLQIQVRFTLADSEIYEMRWSLSSLVVPAPGPPAGTALPEGRWLPDTAAP